MLGKMNNLFSLYLQKEDWAKDLTALLLLLKEKACKDDFSDLVLICTSKAKKLKIHKELINNQLKVQIISKLQALKEEEENFRLKRFLFIILPDYLTDFYAGSILRKIKKIKDDNNLFTAAILLSTRATKKVKKLPFFTSYFNNLDFNPHRF